MRKKGSAPATSSNWAVAWRGGVPGAVKERVATSVSVEVVPTLGKYVVGSMLAGKSMSYKKVMRCKELSLPPSSVAGHPVVVVLGEMLINGIEVVKFPENCGSPFNCDSENPSSTSENVFVHGFVWVTSWAPKVFLDTLK